MDKQIVKSNHVIEASYRLTLNEQRLILLCIQQIKRGQGISPMIGFNIRATDLVEAFGVNSKNAYSDLKEISDILFNRFLTIYQPDPDEPKLESTRTRWISAIDYIPSEGRVRLYFAPKVIPYISLLESGFTRYNLEYIAPMTSVYGVRFYELFKCWLMGEKSKKKNIRLDDLKEILDLKGLYPSIKDFKAYVLDKGLTDVNSFTDLLVSYETKRTGRKITDLEFSISTKTAKPNKSQQQATKPATKRDTASQTDDNERLAKAEKAGIASLEALAKQHGIEIPKAKTMK